MQQRTPQNFITNLQIVGSDKDMYDFIALIVPEPTLHHRKKDLSSLRDKLLEQNKQAFRNNIVEFARLKTENPDTYFRENGYYIRQGNAWKRPMDFYIKRLLDIHQGKGLKDIGIWDSRMVEILMLPYETSQQLYMEYTLFHYFNPTSFFKTISSLYPLKFNLCLSLENRQVKRRFGIQNGEVSAG